MLAALDARRYNVDRMATARITWQDTLLMPEDGKRYEAIDGELCVTPAPTVRHQRISGKLAIVMHRLLEEPGHGLVIAAPVGVDFPNSEEGVQPDLLFVSKARLHIVGRDWIRGAPDLVVEILSPSTAERDRTIKRKLYQRHGVAQYWLVDPEAECVEVWDLTASPVAPSRYVDQLSVKLGDRSLGSIKLPEIFKEP